MHSSQDTGPDRKERRIRKLEAILEVAKAMASQHDLDVLLGMIIENARRVARAERGTIFILDKGKNELWSRVAHGAPEIRFPAGKGIAGRVVETKAPLNIPDAYADPRFNPEVDQQTGYRTQSLLTVPMLTTQQEVVGVLQVLNKKPHEEPSPGAEPKPSFDAEDEELLLAFGGQAAAVENALLYDEINTLFEGFVSASVVAIEARDPTTSGHSGRVATLTCGLAEAVNRTDTGPLARVSFDYDEMKEIRYASLLHDFGKVGVREKVLVKAEKLFPEELSVLLTRFDLIRRTLEKEALERKLIAHGSSDGRLTDALAQIDQESKRQLRELEDMRAFILNCNVPTVLEQGGFERLREIAGRTYASSDGPKPYLTSLELVSLSVARGSLTEEDRLQIESHVTHTYQFLSTIPWTRKLRRVPEIAYGHHEKLDGKGYPRSIAAPQIPVQTRMMTISDIYDALTASDRPYKKAVPTPKALDILQMEAKAGKVDSVLLALFIEAQVYEPKKTAGRC